MTKHLERKVNVLQVYTHQVVAVAVAIVACLSPVPTVAVAEPGQVASPGALQWFPYMEPSSHKLHLPGESQDTTLTLSDAPIIRHSQLQEKYQLFSIKKLVDFTNVSLTGANLAVQLQRFGEDTVDVHQEYFSRSNFMFEFFITEDLGFDHCTTLCIAKQGKIVHTEPQLYELRILAPRHQGTTWCSTSQNMTGGRYHVYFDTSNPVEIYPTNMFNNESVTVYQLNDDEPAIVTGNIGNRVFYYDKTSNSYYRGERYGLKTRWSVSGDFQLLIPKLSSSHESPFDRARCVCTRDISQNLQSTLVANSMVKYTKLHLDSSLINIEAQRLKRHSNPSLSNVDTLLSTQSFYRNEDQMFLSEKDIYPLIVDTVSPANPPAVHPRHTRVAPIAGLAGSAMLKVAAYSAPYVLSNQIDVLQKFARETKGKLLKPVSNGNWSSSGVFQNFVNHKYKDSPVNVQFNSDRVIISLKDNPPQLSQYLTPDVSQAQMVERVGQDLRFVKERLFPVLPDLMLQEVLPALPYPIRDNSQVLVQVERSASFWRLTFIMECQRKELSYTDVSVSSLPHKEENGFFYHADVPRDHLAVTQAMPSSTLQHVNLKQKQCADLLLSDTAQDVLAACGAIQFDRRIVTNILTLPHGQLFLLEGPGKLAYQCVETTAVTMLLQYQYNLVYISLSCDFSLEHAGLVFEQSKTSQLVFPVPVFLILTYNTPQSVSTAEWNTLWLSCISTAGGCLFILLIVLFAKVLTFQKQRFVTPSDMSFEVDGRVHHSTPERSGESRQARDGPLAVSLQSYLDPQHDDSHAGENAISFQQLSNFHNNGAASKFNNTKKV